MELSRNFSPSSGVIAVLKNTVTCLWNSIRAVCGNAQLLRQLPGSRQKYWGLDEVGGSGKDLMGQWLIEESNDLKVLGKKKFVSLLYTGHWMSQKTRLLLYILLLTSRTVSRGYI